MQRSGPGEELRELCNGSFAGKGVRLIQGPWANIGDLRWSSARALDLRWWLLGIMIEPEVGADERARTNAWRTGGVGGRARDIRGLLVKSYLIKVMLPQVDPAPARPLMS